MKVRLNSGRYICISEQWLIILLFLTIAYCLWYKVRISFFFMYDPSYFPSFGIVGVFARRVRTRLRQELITFERMSFLLFRHILFLLVNRASLPHFRACLGYQLWFSATGTFLPETHRLFSLFSICFPISIFLGKVDLQTSSMSLNALSVIICN